MENNSRCLRNNIKYLIKEAWDIDKSIFLYFFLFTISSSLMPFIPIFTPKLLIDEITGKQRVEAIIIISLVAFIISAILNYFGSLSRFILDPKLVRIKLKLTTRLDKKCMDMDLKYIENKDVLNKYNAALTSLDSGEMGIEAVYSKLFSIFGSILAFSTYVAIVFTLSPWVLLYMILNVCIVYFLNLKGKKYEHSLKDERAELNRKSNYIYNIMSDFTYGKDIRIFKLKTWLKNKFNDFLDADITLMKKINFNYLILSFLDIFLLLIREGIIYAYLIYSVIYKDMQIGDFTMYFATIAGFATWMEMIMRNLSFIKGQNLYITDLRDFFEVDKKDSDLVQTRTFTIIPKDTNYEIEFKNVSFKYPLSEKYIYKNLSLKIKKGEKLAIVGTNGAGKTTFIKLLTGLYDPTEGEILLNGINIKYFNKNDYYKLFSAVFQEIKIMAFSVSENVALKEKDSIDRDRVISSLKRADVYDKINSLSYGIDTNLLKILDKEGVELSGGQNQKLALARALYKDGKIIILDEPTAALDAISEYKTYLSFNNLTMEKTAIYVSHRLASTRFCDVIAFFEDGEIKEYGTHEELLQKNGLYKNMFDVQSQYYKEDNVKEGA